MLLDYIKERYGNEVNNDEELLYALLVKYMQELKGNDVCVYSDKTGFISYKLEGDAGIVFDVYTTPEYRKKKAAWTLFNRILAISEKAGKRVIISFSDKMGQNHADGVGAMNSAGFKPAFETSLNTVFIRGV